MGEAFRMTMDRELNVNGEYYVSLAYKPLLAANRPVAVYPLQHFMQWGTPEDVAEYNGWSAAFKRLIVAENALPTPRGSLVIPMAGLGQRFVDEGFSVTKPLIPVSGKPMITQATHDLPAALHHVFVLEVICLAIRKSLTNSNASIQRLSSKRYPALQKVKPARP